MSTVYIDILITVNIFIDFFLILCTKLLLHIRAGLPRMVLGAVTGGALSLTALLPRLPAGLDLVISAVLAVPVVLAAFGLCKAKVFLKRTAVYFFCSFVFCGIMLAVCTSLRPKGMAVYHNVIYFNISPILLIILTLICYGAIRLFERFAKDDVCKQVCEVTVSGENGSVTFSALADTGCQVREPFSGYYVIIAETELVADIKLSKGFRLIPYRTLGGNGTVRGYLPESVAIDGKKYAQPLYLGVCENVLKGDVRAIIPYELIKQN